MPRNKGRREETGGDWELNKAEEDDSGANSGTNQNGAGEIDQFGDGNNNDYVRNSGNDARPRHMKSVGSSRHRNKHGHGPWSDVVTETVQRMEAARLAIKNLQDNFKSDVDDLGKMEQTREKLQSLEQECAEYKEEIREKVVTINTLTGINLQGKENVEREKSQIEKERKDLEDEKRKSRKRIPAMIAEEKLKLDTEFEKRCKVHDESNDKRKKELEDSFIEQKDENSRQVTALVADNRQLVAMVEEQKKTIDDLEKKLGKSDEQCDVLERAKDSFKREKAALKIELETMKTEFALSPKPKEYFKREFAEICIVIEGIALKYFNDLDGKDLETIQDQLAKADDHFASIPIDYSDDSYKLRIAHAQRIISESICESIWKPFRSDFTLSHPDFNDLLARISDELEKSGRSSRAANVWTALTMRALRSLPADSGSPPVTELKKPPRPTGVGRADAVVSKVLSILSPLVGPAQQENLCIDLLKLANASINIWNEAQTGELKIIANLILDPGNREEWRSNQFDPALASYDDAISKTHPRIFTLFPQLVARESVDLKKNVADLPGSWPADSDPTPLTRDTYIHHGIGLPESSSLVIRGKEEQEEKIKRFTKGLEDLKKEIHGTRRPSVQGGRNSMGGGTSAASSPSQQWKMGGVMESTET